VSAHDAFLFGVTWVLIIALLIRIVIREWMP
jgi:hypothetical protein